MALESGTTILPQLESLIRNKEEPFDVIIIGGGPAGLTAGIYCGRAGFKTLLIEKALLGGQISTVSEVANYPGFPSGISGLELAARLEDQAKKFDVEVAFADVQGLDVSGGMKKVKLADSYFWARCLIIASGAQPKKLGIPGEDELRGRGVSYCATCDGAFYKGKEIVMVGGGNSAIQEALFLTRFASKVYIVHRRDKLRAEKIISDKAASDPKITFIWNTVAEKMVGKDKVEGLQIRNLTDNKTSVLPVEGVFIYVGETPNSSIVKDIVDLSEEGFIIVDQDMKTSAEGIFAAGDVCRKTLRQISTAVGDGAVAADSVRKRLENMI